MHRKVKKYIKGSAIISIPLITFGLGFPFSLSAVAEGSTSSWSNSTEEEKVPYINLAKRTGEESKNLKPQVGSKSSASVRSTFDLKVSNASQYDIYVSTYNDELVKENSTSTIKPMFGQTEDVGSIRSITEESGWGYRAAVDDSIVQTLTTPYKAVPEVAEGSEHSGPADKIASASAADTGVPYLYRISKVITLEVGAAVDATKEAGTYTGSVILSAVATPRSLTIFDISDMQDMTDSICEATPTPARFKNDDETAQEIVDQSATTIREVSNNQFTDSSGKIKTNVIPETTLTDTRDGNTYLIRKLADGHCWMTQNLALDFLPNNQGPNAYYMGNNAAPTTSAERTAAVTEGKILTADTIAVELTPNNTDIDDTLAASLTKTNAKGEKVWTPDNIPGSRPLFTTTAGTRQLRRRDSPYVWALDGKDGLRSYSIPGSVIKCTPAAHEADPMACDQAISLGVTENPWGAKEVNGRVKVYDLYLGTALEGPYSEYNNYYNYAAATLGTSYSVVSGITTNSICPKGWKLPANTDVQQLLGVYDISDGWNVEGNNRLKAAPLNFLNTGYYDPSYGNLFTSRNNQTWTESTTQGENMANHLTVYEGNNVNAAYSNYRGYGFAIRCVAR